MPNLINRDPPGRLSCVHALLRSLWYRFGTDRFTGVKAKHKEGGKSNPIEYCRCAKEYSPGTAIVRGHREYCPFLRAGSSRSYCYLVNSDVLDTQKSKAVGEAIQALEALGLCHRELNALKRLRYAALTNVGISIAKCEFLEQKARKYYENEVVNYGPIVGFLHLLDITKGREIKHAEISKHMGRPNNYDKVKLVTGDEVILNDGDAKDARTRTTGALQAWLTYTGYMSPQARSFLDSFSEIDRFYCDPTHKLGYSRIFANRDKVEAFFAEKPLVQRPLSYDFYIKGLGTAREYSQRSLSGRQLENLALREFAPKVRDRRLLLMYSYSLAAEKNKGLDLLKIGRLSNFKNSPFVVDKDTHEKVLVDSEVNFLTIAGAPFLRSEDDFTVIYPRVRISVDPLRKVNPFLTSLMDKVASNREIYI